MMKELQVVSASITVLVDNTVMELIPGGEMVERISMPGKNFIAEHGFSALVETDEKKILIDTGATGIALEHNLGLIGLVLDDIDAVFISHGHNDHTGGFHKLKGRIIAHPDSFHKRYFIPREGMSYELTSPAIDPIRHMLEFHRGPVMLSKGVMTTGEIPRRHAWEQLDVFKIKKNGRLLKDRLLDDQGVIISTARGLMVISGCSHAGIINTIEHAMELTGVRDIFCAMGGFHLIGPGEARIERTINELRRLKVKKIIPLHCTGFEAIKRISTEMSREFEYVTAGCRIKI